MIKTEAFSIGQNKCKTSLQVVTARKLKTGQKSRAYFYKLVCQISAYKLQQFKGSP